MEFLTKPQEKALNKMARLSANDEAKKKGYFPKRRFKKQDIKKMIENRKRVVPVFKSVLKAPRVIKKYDANKAYAVHITLEQFEKLDYYIKETLGMDSWGVATFTEKEIYQGMGIPYKHIIVMSRHMKKDHFVVKELPNMDCMLEVMEVYGRTGVACLRGAEFLREMGFGAVPNHSLGGNVDYTKAAYKANLGYIGKGGMLITPHSGPCNRISIIYTSIENLDEFLKNDEDYSWGNDFCKKCKKCVKSCPYDAIYEEDKVDEHGHVTCISNDKCNSGFSEYGCGICIACCPFTIHGYDKIKKGFLKAERNY